MQLQLNGRYVMLGPVAVLFAAVAMFTCSLPREVGWAASRVKLKTQPFTMTVKLVHPMGFKQEVALEAMWVRPTGKGPFPLAVISHGSPRGHGATAHQRRRKMTPKRYVAVAQELARRGWAAAIFMRRGYGKSQGEWAERPGACTRSTYKTAGNTTANDYEGTINFLSRHSFIDKESIIAIGQSAGGFGVVALAGRDIPGLRGVINLGGGRGSPRKNFICGPEKLVSAFASFGEKAKVPSLWIYPHNDNFFSPRWARRFHKSFVDAGGKASLHILKMPKNGHSALIRYNGVARWRSKLDRFLRSNNLQYRAR